MAEVTGFTAEKMRIIENETVVDGEIQGDNLILLTREGTPIDAGNVRGPIGPQGIVGPVQSVNDQIDAVFTPRTFADKAALDLWTPVPDGAAAYTIAEQTDWVRVLGTWMIAPQHRVFVDEAQRNTKWPTPPIGALCQAPAGVWWIWITGSWKPLKTGIPTIWAGIGEMVVISGAAGTGPGNPRVIGMAVPPYRTWKAPFTGTGTQINILEAGLYEISLTLRTKAWWAFFGGIRLMRGSTPMLENIHDYSRGTWGNPPGVIGFDQGFVNEVVINCVTTAQANDNIQILGYTTGGGDTTSTAGGGGSMIGIRQIRNDLQHEASTNPPTGRDADSPEEIHGFPRPVHYIRRPGFPESYPPGEEDPGV